MLGRSSATYERNVSNIGAHLRAIQTELAKIGTKAGQQAASAGAEQASQLAEDLAALFNRSQSYAADRAAELSKRAVQTSSHAAERMAAQIREQPILMLAVALGIGLLIGFSARTRS
jgi:ElaB/YqjD/DUF883 family membrane-anchored ribosome-binding protein